MSQTILIESELIDQCRNGDLQNFRKVVEKASPFVFSVAFRMLGDEESARDVVQDTMVTVWDKISRIKNSGSFKTWIFKIAVNRCYDLMRKKKQNPEFRFDERAWALISDQVSEDTSSELENKEIASVINLLTARLSPRQKSIFILSEIEQLSNEEVAAITGMNKMTIKANLYHARRNIQEMIGKYL